MMLHRALAVVTALVLFAPLGRAAELDPYLPEDSESVLNVNVRQILDSQIVKKNFLETAQEALRSLDQAQDVLNDLGFDPFKDLDRILLASPGGTEKDRGLVIVHGRFDVAKFKKKAEQVAKDEAEHLTIHKILGGKQLLYEVNLPDVDDPLFVALAGGDTLLASAGKDYVVDALKKIGANEKPTLKDKKFQALLEKIDTRQSVSLAMVKNPDILKVLDKASGDIKAMIEKVQALGGGLTIGDDVKLELVFTTKTTRDAKELSASAKASLNLVLALAAAFTQNNDSPEAEFVVEIIKGLRITNKKEALVVKGRISSDLIEETLKKK
ncbi:MAG TPA: hypothetical protein VMG10_20875, partial [Gemmataceae bacterium]|nr:hypothetical protein [Gemmataceae bacterium]